MRLSNETGIHRNYIGGIERAEREPTLTTVITLAEALGISMTELFARAEGPDTPHTLGREP
jgi:transcriptional regulator with XRE-family HTH domain